MSFFDLFSAWTCGTCTVTESRPEKEVPEAVLQEANDKEEEILPGPVLHPLRNIEESQKMLEVKVEVEKKPAKKLQESPDPKEVISSDVPEPPKLDPNFLRERRPKTTRQPSRQSKEAEKAIAKIKMSSCQCGCDDAYGAYGQPLRLPS